MRKNFSFVLTVLAVLTLITFMTSQAKAQTELLIRCDDVGMCHTVNMAVKKLGETGIPFSTSVMFACPWYKEAVEILKANPQISVGIHLVLNSEWKNYKWGPVAGKEAVPSLVNNDGYFYESEADFSKGLYKLNEVETELRAQIERAIHSGLQIDYVDEHMGTAVSTPELRTIVEKLAKEYNLGISLYFNETYQTLWDTAPEKKFSRLLEVVDSLKSNEVNLLVIHLGMKTDEMEALIDMNNPDDPYRIAQHRQAELDALCSGKFEKAIQKNNVKFTTYKELISKVGLKDMSRPTDTEY